MKVTSALGFLAIALVGCSGGPGAPLVRTDANDGEGPLIAGCSNVSKEDATDQYIVGYYLTTWDSASKEGAVVGLMTASKNADPVRDLVNSWLPTSEIFCRSYSVSRQRAYRIVKQVLPELGYKIIYASEPKGVITTDFVVQKRPPINKWKDRYVVNFEDTSRNEVIVRVLREVQISRCVADLSNCSEYIRASSVGHNEAWILHYIGSQVGD